MKKLLIISLDAVPSNIWRGELTNRRNAALFSADAETVLGVRSVFPSNTYPVHCSVVTGLPPCSHGVTGNTDPFPLPHPKWVTDSSAIKARTLWQAAAEAGLRVASVLWPCTGGSRHIRYNIPETHPLPGQNQILENLKAGSKLLQLSLLARYGGQLKAAGAAGAAGGTESSGPALDDFITSCAAYILERKKPDLTFVHLYCFDILGHKYGLDPEMAARACDSLDKSIGRLLEAAGEGASAIIFSDHAQLPVHTEVSLNDILVEMELLGKDNDSYVPGAHDCFFECVGGCAFFHAGTLPDKEIGLVRDRIETIEGFSRFLSEGEIKESGKAGFPFGLGLKRGFAAVNYPENHKGNHGYPLDMPDYDVFYSVRGEGFAPGKIRQGGSLLDIAPIAASLLGI